MSARNAAIASKASGCLKSAPLKIRADSSSMKSRCDFRLIFRDDNYYVGQTHIRQLPTRTSASRNSEFRPSHEFLQIANVSLEPQRKFAVARCFFQRSEMWIASAD